MFELEFNKFTEKYDFNDDDIRLKYNHSYRVRNLCLKYAYFLKLNKDDTRLIEFIGLYHDIGRFTQLEKYHTYNDSISIDHADEGVRVLFEDGLINKFDFTEEEKDIIKFAIKNHNKLEIEEETNERKLYFAKLIRDLDKLDIIYLSGILKEVDLKVVDIEFEDEIINSFKDGKLIKYSDIPNRDSVVFLGYAFDINFDVIIDEFIFNIKEFYKTLNNERVFKEIYSYVINYLEKRKENVRY